MAIFMRSKSENSMSKHLDIALDMAQALKKFGVVDAVTMHEIETLCLPPKPRFDA